MHFKLYEGYVKETNNLSEQIARFLADGKVDNSCQNSYRLPNDRVAIEGAKLGDELNPQVADAMIPLDSAHGTRRRRASWFPPGASRSWRVRSRAGFGCSSKAPSRSSCTRRFAAPNERTHSRRKTIAKIKLDIPHSLAPDEAQKRVEALFGYWGRKYGVKSSWTGEVATFAGKVMRISFDGQLSVLAGKITGEAADPGLLLRGQAEKYLTRTFADYLDPAKKLADLARDE